MNPLAADRTAAFVAALRAEESRFQDAIDRLETLAQEDDVDRHVRDDLDGAARTLRDSVEFVRCLRRLVAGRTPKEIHDAFGAPGDFGYETPFGDALARFYGVIS